MFGCDVRFAIRGGLKLKMGGLVCRQYGVMGVSCWNDFGRSFV